MGFPGVLRAQTDCLACHGDKTLQDASGHSVGVDGDNFHASIHGSLSCTDCHTIDQGVSASGHGDRGEVRHLPRGPGDGDRRQHSRGASAHPCTSCHGDAHSIYPKDNPKSAVYPLNIPKTCGTCHANEALAKKYGLQNVYSHYMDSIHGYAVSKEGLLVAANCMSCHGSHGILSHKDPKSTTSRENIPNTCGACHGGVKDQYFSGVHGKALAAGNEKVPVCTDCHTAHAILQPTDSTFRMQSTPICGSCHKDQLATYRDTFHSQLGLLGGYVETARCWDCHGAHEVLPASRSGVAGEQGQPDQDLRAMPRGCEFELCAVSAACESAQSQVESGAVFCAAVHEFAAVGHAEFLHAAHAAVVHSGEEGTGQERAGGGGET